jgi:hypothetical protein
MPSLETAQIEEVSIVHTLMYRAKVGAEVVSTLLFFLQPFTTLGIPAWLCRASTFLYDGRLLSNCPLELTIPTCPGS